jgi:hypothetical protein
MLEFLRGGASDRKLRLFAVACCRRLWHLLGDECSRQLVELIEHCADNPNRNDRLSAAAWQHSQHYRIGLYVAAPPAAAMAHDAAGAGAWAAAWKVVTAAQRAVGLNDRTRVCDEDIPQANLLRELFGNPFRSVPIDPLWLWWSNQAVLGLARTIYEDRCFDVMPILADALEDAGCHDADILNHCRQPGEHARGCWVIDLLLDLR